MDLQQRLQMLGHYKGDLNGVYDLETAQAVPQPRNSWTCTRTALSTCIHSRHLFPPPTRSSMEKNTAIPERVSVIIDMDRLTLTLFNEGEPYKQYPVAMGKYESPTPVGNWEII